MSQATAIPESPKVDKPMVAVPARCLRCSTDLTRLPEWARYCPKCGLDTHQSPPAAILSYATVPGGGDDRFMGWEHLRELAAPQIPAAREISAIHEPTSVMLTGYSNAMYNLGQRYETGLGAAKNPREAARCYVKAARLGNFWALARLAVQYLGREHANDRNTLR